MMGRKHDKPKVVELSEKEFTALKKRVTENKLSEADRHLIINFLNFMVWLQHKLNHAKISLHKLRKLFGFGDRPSTGLPTNDLKTDDKDDDEPLPEGDGSGKPTLFTGQFE